MFCFSLALIWFALCVFVFFFLFFFVLFFDKIIFISYISRQCTVLTR
jgi:hypothetical protein